MGRLQRFSFYSLRMWKTLLEEQDMWLRLVYLVMLPSQTLPCVSHSLEVTRLLIYLSDSKPPPFFFMQEFKRPFRRIEIVLGNCFEHCLWKLNMTILVVIIRVSVNPS